MIQEELVLPNGVRLKNRLIKAATSELLATSAGAPADELIRLYRTWAAGTPGLMISGNAIVDDRYPEGARNVILREENAPELTRWAEAAQATGVPLLIQISHAGRQTPRIIAPTPVAPSAVNAVKVLYSFGKPRALEATEIDQVERQFIDAALLVERSGFAGIQIHAAHGYLLSQFLSPETNLRTDAWGGDISGRARLLLNIVSGIRKATSSKFIISVKVSSTDFAGSADDGSYVMRELAKRGADLIEVSGGTYEKPLLFDRATTKKREGFFRDFAGLAKRASSAPIMLTGGMRTPSGMSAAIREGVTDAIGLGRPIIVDPGLPARLLRGESPPPDRSFEHLPHTFRTFAVNAWHAAQLHRIGRGQQTDPKMGILIPMLRHLGAFHWNALTRTKPRPVLAEAAASRG